MIDFLKKTTFNLPQTTRLASVTLMLIVALIHVIQAAEHLQGTAYLGAALTVVAVGAVIAAAGIWRGARGWGWTLGAIVCGIALMAYLTSRLIGLPGLDTAGAWSEPLGTVSMALELLFIGLYLLVLTGMSVTAPERPYWQD